MPGLPPNLISVPVFTQMSAFALIKEYFCHEQRNPW